MIKYEKSKGLLSTLNFLLSTRRIFLLILPLIPVVVAREQILQFE